MKTSPDIVVRAEVYKEDYSAPATLFVNYPTSDTESVECGVLFDEESDIPRVYIKNSQTLPFLQIRAVHPMFERNLWIPRMRIEHPYREHTDRTFRGVAEMLFEGDIDGFQGGKGSLECYVLLQENALLSFYEEHGFTQWDSPFGLARLIHDYRYGGYIRDMKERKPQKQDMIHIKLDPTQYNSLHDLGIEIADYLDDLMWLISFFCKKYIHWYQFDMYYEPEKRDIDKFRIINGYREPKGVLWNRTEVKSPGFENHPADLLIQLETIRGEIASQVFKTYIDSPEKKTIRQLIITVMITFTDAVIEQNLAMVYTALETLVNAYSKQHYILGSSQFKKLDKAIREFLSSQSDVKLTPEQLEEIKRKIPELRRYSYTSKLTTLFDAKLKMIPESIGYKLTPQILLKRLEQAVDRRNEFIHAGKIENVTDILGDFALIRFLVSIWILDLLGYPLDQINENDHDLMNLDWAIRKASDTQSQQTE